MHVLSSTITGHFARKKNSRWRPAFDSLKKWQWLNPCLIKKNRVTLRLSQEIHHPKFWKTLPTQNTCHGKFSWGNIPEQDVSCAYTLYAYICANNPTLECVHHIVQLQRRLAVKTPQESPVTSASGHTFLQQQVVERIVTFVWRKCELTNGLRSSRLSSRPGSSAQCIGTKGYSHSVPACSVCRMQIGRPGYIGPLGEIPAYTRWAHVLVRTQPFRC